MADRTGSRPGRDRAFPRPRAPAFPGVMMRFGIVIFPASNCDRDCVHVLRTVLGHDVEEVWHEAGSLDGVDAVVLPGGFAYGDYLRAGAVAAPAPGMTAGGAFARAQGRVLPDANPNGSIRNVAGVCNPAGNVVGLMPHPERASEELLGSDDGRLLFESAVMWLETRKRSLVTPLRGSR